MFRRAANAVCRTFPHPWRIIEEKQAYKLIDASGRPVAYVPFEETEDLTVLSPLSRNEALKIARDIAITHRSEPNAASNRPRKH